MSKTVVVVGGVAGGATAVARLRRLDESLKIILLERGEYVSFANCGLPYYIGGVINSRKALFVSSPEAINSKYNVDVRVNNEVVSIDRANKQIKVKNTKTNEEYLQEYDTLLVSTGSSPIVPPANGFDGENVFTLWNISDTDKVYSYINENKIEKAVVIGGGFVGLEMVENLVHLGIKTTVVEKANQVMAPLDHDMAKIVHSKLREQGVELLLENGVVEIQHSLNDGKHTSKIVLENGEVETDMIILAIGIRPNTLLLREAGLSLNQRGGVIVDEYLRTEDPNIYAVGDIVEIDEFVLGGKTMIPLASPANKQGRIAADNIVNQESSKYTGSQGTSIAQIFDINVASTGLNEKTLQRLGEQYKKDYLITVVHPSSHATYYPNANPMTIKLIFRPKTGKVLGAQIVGKDGVDKRIDVIATAIRFDATVYDLAELELAYAPPFSSAKDPVNMAGYVSQNMLEGLVDVVRVAELESTDGVVIDVREESERKQGYVPNSVHIPLGKLRAELKNLDKNQTYIMSCQVGLRGYLATRILLENGFKALNLQGGYKSFSQYFEL